MRGLLIFLAATPILAAAHAQTPGSPPPATGPGQTFTGADVQGALDKAEECRREGKYTEALQLQLWYHKNALKYDPAQAGVRLSFALSDWVELGRVYSPALHALRSVRNDALTGYKKDPSDSLIFGEAMSIDLALDDLHSAKALFYLGRKSKVHDDSLLLELDRLLDTGDLKWASDVVGNPTVTLNEIKRDREMSVAGLSARKDLVKGLDGMYAAKIGNLLKVVAKVHGLSSARKLQKQALKFIDTPGIRNALN